MDRTNLKNYAPQARREFIQAMIESAAFYGLTANTTEPIVEKGDIAVIGGRSFPISVARKRKSVEDRIKRQGFQQTMEAMAYTWFNRLVAIRYMELHGYLDHGYRVLSHPDGKQTPEILEHAEHVDFPGLKKDRVIDLKLASNKEGELYRLLLTAQCNALHSAMPFLFERIDDETELLLPDNLLNSDSMIRKLVNEIDEADWNEVEIIGWLYQFYISEKKDEVIGKVVASEDIPAATQLFTPNWIVKYLAQNTLGRQWLATYPDSPLRQQMEYYIEPAEQTPEVQEQLKTITPTSLNPEELTLLDPACGSGHILVEAYDLFKAIYQERGYRAKDIPALILQKNLFGMEIDDRAAQLAAFALMMKARADDRRIFDSEAKPNIMAFEDSQGMNANEIAYALNAPINKDDVPNEYLFEEIQEEKDGLFSKKALAEKGHVSQTDIASLLELFENAKTFGSLIQVPPKLAAKLPEIEKRLDNVLKYGDLTHASAHVLKPLLEQARLLARQYDVVVANPPYMKSKYFPSALKAFASKSFALGNPDLYGCFIERNLAFSDAKGCVGMITIPNWMFLSSFTDLRKKIATDSFVVSCLHNGRGVWGPDFGSCSFVLERSHNVGRRSVFRRLFQKQGEVQSNEELVANFHNKSNFPVHSVDATDFLPLPDCIFAYWVSLSIRNAFIGTSVIEDRAPVRQGFQTGDNDKYLRLWHELDYARCKYDATSKDDVRGQARWVPYNKGGAFRKWYGNNDYLVAFNQADYEELLVSGNCLPSRQLYFREAVTWSSLSISLFSARFSPQGFTFSAKGACAFPSEGELHFILALLNSIPARKFFEFLSATVDFNVGSIRQVPFPKQMSSLAREKIVDAAKSCVQKTKLDWDSEETSWEFVRCDIVPLSTHETHVEKSWDRNKTCIEERAGHVQGWEEEINRHFIEAYGLQDELSPEVPDEQITLYRPDRTEDIKRLLSYAIGCMMGRYSLDKPGLIYAHSGNQGFDASQYQTFRADDDGIIPLLETDWGIRDDATNRFVEFIGVAWPKEHLEENLKFVADSLGPTASEQSRDTIRRYLATGFYKHHLPMYKKRPIYWLFSSGKQRAFQCLVYLHRYHEGTLARMRTEYVIPLQGQIASRIEQIEGDKAKATSTSHRKKLQKEQDDLKKQQVELATFEEKVKHYADMRISLDLDDGVKVNYAKFGDLLAESKAITGGKDEE